MLKYFSDTPAKELQYISTHLSSENKNELALWLNKAPEEITVTDIALTLRLSCIGAKAIFVLYDEADAPGAFGCVSPEGEMTFVICRGICRKTYVRWLRLCKEIVRYCAALAGGRLTFLADPENKKARRWFSFAGFKRVDAGNVTLASSPLHYYEYRLPMAE